MKNTAIVILALISLIIGIFYFSDTKLSSSKEAAYKERIDTLNEEILSIREANIIYRQEFDSLQRLSILQKKERDSLIAITNKLDSIYEIKIDSIINASTDSIASFIRSEITRRFFENKSDKHEPIIIR